MATMHVPTYTVLTTVEQCQQLEDYLKELDSNLSFTTVDRLIFSTNLKEVIASLEAVFELEKESEAESVLNSVVTLLFELPLDQEETKTIIESFCSIIKDENKSQKLAPRLRVAKNLHDGLFGNLDLQYLAYVAIVTLATKNNRLSEVFSDLEPIKTKYSVKTIGLERAQNLYRLLNKSAIQAGKSELASRVMIELLGTYTEQNASHAEKDAIDCITSFLKDPNTFLMDHLLTLTPVSFLEGKPIHDLLTIFVKDKLQNYLAFYKDNKNFVDGLGLNHERNVQKMRLLTFMQIAESRKEISYETIMSELQIELDQVEPFVFDVLRTHLVRAKIDQLNKRVLVQSTMHRTFGTQQWEQLRRVLSEWKNNFSRIEKTIKNFTAQRR